MNDPDDNPFWGEPTPTDLWDDMGTLNSLYSEMCWKNNEPLECITDYANDQSIIRRKKWIKRTG